jgi:hypothetical protein
MISLQPGKKILQHLAGELVKPGLENLALIG